MVFSDLAKSTIEKSDAPERAEDFLEDFSQRKDRGFKSVICNQDRYDADVIVKCEKGARLQLNENTPIGYNIFLPNLDVKAVVTYVYGGSHKDNRVSEMRKPHQVNALQRSLLSNGVAVVTLNLIDLLELDASQRQLPYFLHHRLHASINKVFEVLRNNPASLHEKLALLREKPQFLYGVSFGGRTAVRHAEYFPDTYNGYISIAGALSFKHTTAHYKTPFVEKPSSIASLSELSAHKHELYAYRAQRDASATEKNFYRKRFVLMTKQICHHRSHLLTKHGTHSTLRSLAPILSSPSSTRMNN